MDSILAHFVFTPGTTSYSSTTTVDLITDVTILITVTGQAWASTDTSSSDISPPNTITATPESFSSSSITSTPGVSTIHTISNISSTSLDTTPIFTLTPSPSIPSAVTSSILSETPEIPHTNTSTLNKDQVYLVSILVPTAVLGIFSLMACMFYRHRRRNRQRQSDKPLSGHSVPLSTSPAVEMIAAWPRRAQEYGLQTMTEERNNLLHNSRPQLGPLYPTRHVGTISRLSEPRSQRIQGVEFFSDEIREIADRLDPSQGNSISVRVDTTRPSWWNNPSGSSNFSRESIDS